MAGFHPQWVKLVKTGLTLWLYNDLMWNSSLFSSILWAYDLYSFLKRMKFHFSLVAYSSYPYTQIYLDYISRKHYCWMFQVPCETTAVNSKLSSLQKMWIVQWAISNRCVFLCVCCRGAVAAGRRGVFTPSPAALRRLPAATSGQTNLLQRRRQDRPGTHPGLHLQAAIPQGHTSLYLTQIPSRFRRWMFSLFVSLLVRCLVPEVQ